MLLRRAQLAALQRGSCVGILGAQAERLGVLDDREVVVLLALGVAGAVQRAGRGAPAGEQAEREQRGEAVAAAGLSSGMKH